MWRAERGMQTKANIGSSICEGAVVQEGLWITHITLAQVLVEIRVPVWFSLLSI